MTNLDRPYTTGRPTNDEEAPTPNARDLTQLATAINERSEPERELENQVFDHRVGTGNLLIEARAEVKAQRLKWEAWCAANIQRSLGDIRKLMRLASAENPREARQTEKAKNREGVRRTRENKTGKRAYVSALPVDGLDGGAGLDGLAVSAAGAKGNHATIDISALSPAVRAQIAAAVPRPALSAATKPEPGQSEAVQPAAAQPEPENRGVARLLAALPKGHEEAAFSLDTGRGQLIIDLLMAVVLKVEGEIPEEAVILDCLKRLGLYDYADSLSQRPKKPIDRPHPAVVEKALGVQYLTPKFGDHASGWLRHPPTRMRVDFRPKALKKYQDGTEFLAAIKKMDEGHLKIMYRSGKPKGNGQGKPSRTSAPKRKPKNNASQRK
jgi:hypothetical protein